MRYVLNSPVLTGYGNWTFSGPLSVEQAQAFLAAGEFCSAIGHESTAQLLSQLLRRDIPFQRQTVAMEPGDDALVFRLQGRLPEGCLLTLSSLSS
ncbi:STIV orfB116 family protein, partial [Acidithiobacillus caldus]